MARKKIRRDVVEEFDRYFGNASNLANWQRLCWDVGIEEDLNSVRKCRQALSKVFVNIWDLLDAVKADTTPTLFPNRRELANYTMRTRRVYPKEKAKEEGPVRALLIHIFN
ncbi:hypothetical protein G7Y89_g6692 [Cudoniella acicularis]|uniref:Uncharacterized protein n=1 Tax=Cudoniella acicularis TaxID=354080 RepID=A0A8H4RJY6_9HELO|nr:hypothetical protein G7Y89_g6692 [Cudoniella acicularis]